MQNNSSLTNILNKNQSLPNLNNDTSTHKKVRSNKISDITPNITGLAAENRSDETPWDNESGNMNSPKKDKPFIVNKLKSDFSLPQKYPVNEEQLSRQLSEMSIRERQNTINEIHPFGVKIWKPALYKKQRAVNWKAVNDTQEFYQKNIPAFVTAINLVWSVTFGLLLCLITLISSVIIYFLGGMTEKSKKYRDLLISTAFYLFHPFGTVVFLHKDKKYLLEDENDGISPEHFNAWATLHNNRLFLNHNNERIFENSLLLKSSPLDSYYGSIERHSRFQNLKKVQEFNTQNTKLPSISSNYFPLNPYINLMDKERTFDTFDVHSITENKKYRLFGRGPWSWQRLIFFLTFYTILQPFVLFVSFFCWLSVFPIPISIILWKLMYHLRKHPLALGYEKAITYESNKNITLTPHHYYPLFKKDQVKRKKILLCTFRCAGVMYYKYTIEGINVIVVNLSLVALFTILDYFYFQKYANIPILTNKLFIFLLGLISIIPLSFYIGQSIASISTQTSMGLGAVLNAFFSTIVELFLYIIALRNEKKQLVDGSIVGSILGAILLLPGIAMSTGAFKRKVQHYNPTSAGISATLLLYSIILISIPTMVYMLYKDEPLKEGSKGHLQTYNKIISNITPVESTIFFQKVLEPLSIICVILLLLAYMTGLYFTLRTHKNIIWYQQSRNSQKYENIASNEEGVLIRPENNARVHPKNNSIDTPNWSKRKSTLTLLISTLIYSIIAEILINCLNTIILQYPNIPMKLLGLILFALVPNTTEFLNAVSFSLNGNVMLSLEIGTAYALQICLLQIPFLVLYSHYFVFKVYPIPTYSLDYLDQIKFNTSFTLVFPLWDIISLIFSTLLFAYIYAEGKSNYFKGTLLILLYIAIISVFYFQTYFTV
ncbi:hypothetical protein TBLA_0H00210 [Henningerozyma blattae CBS 6284]|uniref:Sodium/calcium exchanger membrane region domain-containing protein n=1 Tax=Henningerozyma blattae (strain ATCC 34711 / CBS 6284 / DSM 70876 / NBRC 10599 / NRRL Y-10934 / UCD 77-7) TaxID=1071380 RepID=I2H7G2_HENB6|nr:hypothetical protein TBLA_0H00210 [Tetrapisispora blattae CBS 6284]CCH62314.1 hypothetical protein TBLA_0H00210 [Tetrapisispora blattae CBS 6284]